MADLLFGLRGYLVAPYGLLLLIFGHPSILSFSVGLAVACFGEAIRIWGVGYAGKTTRKSVLEAPRLITAGPYAYVRHPLYLGNSLMGLGGAVMACGHCSKLTALLFFSSFVLFYGLIYGIIIQLEEKFLLAQFGEAYQDYEKKVHRFFPTPKPYPNPSGTFNWGALKSSEVHTFIPFLLAVIIMGLRIQ